MLFTFSDNPTVSTTSSPTEIDPCVLTTKQVEGPFYLPSPERRDIVEDKNGELLNLRMQVLSHPDCSPVSGAVVEVWQADAEGNYSGYPEQISKDEWQMFMLFGKNGGKQSNGECINSQLYFSKSFCDNLFTTKEPYTKMGKCSMDFPNDAVFAMAGGKHEGLLLSPNLNSKNKLTTIARIGIASVLK